MVAGADEIKSEINLNALIKGSTWFRWREALWLPKWGVHVFPTELQFQNIIRTAQKLDIIRNRFQKPIQITSWLRPANYNQWPQPYGISGSKMSSHIDGLAVDFIVSTVGSDKVREDLRPELERLGIRMESLDTAHVHIDLRQPGGSGRFFIP
jgi:Peptidase M15